jgi:hypothetical protein
VVDQVGEQHILEEVVDLVLLDKVIVGVMVVELLFIILEEVADLVQ